MVDRKGKEKDRLFQQRYSSISSSNVQNDDGHIDRCAVAGQESREKENDRAHLARFQPNGKMLSMSADVSASFINPSTVEDVPSRFISGYVYPACRLPPASLFLLDIIRITLFMFSFIRILFFRCDIVDEENAWKDSDWGGGGGAIEMIRGGPREKREKRESALETAPSSI